MVLPSETETETEYTEDQKRKLILTLRKVCRCLLPECNQVIRFLGYRQNLGKTSVAVHLDYTYVGDLSLHTGKEQYFQFRWYYSGRKQQITLDENTLSNLLNILIGLDKVKEPYAGPYNLGIVLHGECPLCSRNPIIVDKSINLIEVLIRDWKKTRNEV